MLFDRAGNRKYLTTRERIVFMRTARKFPLEVETFCLVLAFTGCRISEALALTARHIDYANRTIMFETLKQRKRGVFRAVPVPDLLLKRIRVVYFDHAPDQHLWIWGRTTAWKRVKEVMIAARIDQPRAMPKALRHAFAILATSDANIKLNMVQKWMGHARIQTTAIYANAVGKEERRMARRMWR